MAYEKDKPASSTSLRASNPIILANQAAIELALNREHTFSTGGGETEQAQHRQGSARCFFQDSAPTTQVDGGFFESTDLGSLWFDTNSSPDNQFNVLTVADGAGNDTWTPVSDEIIAVLLAANRVFLGTLGVDGNFEVGTGSEFTVTAASGDVAAAGTLEATGLTTVADGSLTKTSAAPTTDTMIANKKYVDDNTKGANPTNVDSEANAMLKSHAYLSQTAGFIAAIVVNTNATISGFLHTTNDPAGAGTLIGANWGNQATSEMSVYFYVPKGLYFEIVTTAGTPSIIWTPLVVGGAAPIDQD